MSSRVDPLLKLGPDARRTEEGEGEVDELRKGFNLHGLNIPGSSATLHSTMGDNDEELKKQPPGNRDCHPGAEWVSIS